MTGEDLLKISKLLLEGLGTTLSLFSLTLILSIPLAIIIAIGKLSKIKILRAVLNFYISVMRGTPLMLQLIFIYFGPYFLFEIKTPKAFNAALVAFVLNYAAYFAEIFRGGIESIPIGQHEAAASLGYTKNQTFFRIILPQVIKRILPASSNEVITLIKDTALATTISVTEMFYYANGQANSRQSLIPIVIAGVFYYLMNLVLTMIFSRLEKKLDYYK
ncbi:MAG: amino acid ABC transporter permease [Clostridiales bacterium]|nr:amino acid ABC transporter permease [Clostridiales bacterium]